MFIQNTVDGKIVTERLKSSNGKQRAILYSYKSIIAVGKLTFLKSYPLIAKRIVIAFKDLQ